jgi:DinB superfamily
MNVSELMTDSLGRIPGLVHGAVDGLSEDDLAWRPDPGANSIAWLVWHLTRIEDDHVADVAGTSQAWDDGWADRFALPLPAGDHGYGHSPAQVGQVRASADLLAG